MNIISVLELGMIFAIMALGVSISYKILNFPDLSVDGSFPLGAAVAASLMIHGVPSIIALLGSIIAGAISGFFTGYIHAKFKITNLLSGIIVMIALYSINLRIMGKANIHLFTLKSIFNDNQSDFVILLLILLICKLSLDFILSTQFGFVLRALGENEVVVKSFGLNEGKFKIIGLMVANSFVALSGGILSQYQGFADIGMGTGMLVTGLASIILGEHIFFKVKRLKLTSIVILGSLVYRFIIALALKIGFAASDLKLITALILLSILVFDNLEVGSKLFKFKLRWKND